MTWSRRAAWLSGSILRAHAFFLSYSVSSGPIRNTCRRAGCTSRTGILEWVPPSSPEAAPSSFRTDISGMKGSLELVGPWLRDLDLPFDVLGLDLQRFPEMERLAVRHTPPRPWQQPSPSPEDPRANDCDAACTILVAEIGCPPDSTPRRMGTFRLKETW